MDAPSDIMTVAEVASYLRVEEPTVCELARKKEIPCLQLGSSYRFKRADIEKWLNARLNRKEPAEAPPIDLQPLLRKQHILFLPGGEKGEVLEALITCLADSPEVENVEELRAGILRRESLMSTGVGLGVAVPHVRLNSIRNLVMAAAVCEKPIAGYDSIDGQPVRIVFMIGAHTSQHAQYLRLLAFISRRLKDEEFRKQLLAANTSEDFLGLLLERKH